jgi:phosphoesterase RecJ-like protein
MQISDILKSSKRILLTTHREPDGDGLGSQLALYYALKKIGKKVSIVNIDKAPDKYDFLKLDSKILIFDGTLENFDSAVILDTNDKRLVSPLYEALEKKVENIIFLDHHPVLEKGPKPTEGSNINTKAASTGELAYDLIQELGIRLDTQIAEALYTSLVFDTQMFRYIRNSSRSHIIAADLLKHSIDPERIHRALFGDFTKNKLLFIAKSLNSLEFFESDKIAFLKINDADLGALHLNKDHTKDLIDMVMNIDTVEAAVLVRQISENEYKLSFRSKGKLEVLRTAESFGGGGHLYAAGAYVKNKTLSQIKHDSLEGLVYALKTYGTKT